MTTVRGSTPGHASPGPVREWSRRRFVAGMCTAAALMPLRGLAGDRGYPSRPVRILAAQAPGGQTDTIARIVARSLSERLDQAFVVENHGGAAGTIAGRMAARAPADGYTLLVGSNAAIASAPVRMEGSGYDPLRDWTPIGRIVRVGYVLAVRPGLETKTLRDLVLVVRARGTPLTVATVGAGSNAAHALALFERVAAIPMLDIPYKGGALGLQAVVSELVDATFCDAALALPLAVKGAVRIPASCGHRRLAIAPDVPTFAEAGYPGVIAEPWYGMVAPAGVPAAVVAELAAALSAMHSDPEVIRRFAALGYETIIETPNEFAAAIRAEAERERLPSLDTSRKPK